MKSFSSVVLLLSFFYCINTVTALPTKRSVSSPAVDYVFPGITTHPPTSPEAYVQRNYFYVGGQYETVENGTDTVMTGQLYVEQLIPSTPCKTYPLIFWHGSAQTGTNWLNTPDGREGWASYFLKKGYVVYIVDQPQRGRSAWEISQGDVKYFTVEALESQFTGTQAYGLWPQASLLTQWPGTGQQGDPIFDQFYASQVQYQANATITNTLNRDAGAALLDTIGPSILITHSQGGQFGWLIADARPDLVKGILALEPSGPPYISNSRFGNDGLRPFGLTFIPIAYDPPVSDPSELNFTSVPPPSLDLLACYRQVEPAKRLVNLAKVPVTVIGSPASYHSQYDYCTVGYLQQAGVDVNYITLASRGIEGNGHFFFIEKNNLEIAALAEEELQKFDCS